MTSSSGPDRGDDGRGELEPAGSYAHPEGGVEPVPDPGLPAHPPRLTDIDPAAERRAERQISFMFVLATLLALAFCAAYLLVDVEDVLLGFSASNLLLGTTLGLALLLIGIGAIQWAKRLMGDSEMIEHRHGAASSAEDRDEALAAFRAGSEESGFGRRSMVRNSLLGALAVLGLPAVILLGDLGPLPGNRFSQTVWRKGMRIVNDVTGLPVKVADIQIGQLVNAEPAVFFPHEGPGGEEIPPEYEGVALQQEKSKAAVIVVRMLPDDIRAHPQRANWGVSGILCFSKICTHVGCPISLWEQQTHHLLCPCHQSTFDLADNGRVIFGPASRSLPQLPIGVDEEGYLIAMSGFREAVGPSFWERGQA